MTGIFNLTISSVFLFGASSLVSLQRRLKVTSRYVKLRII